MRRTALDHLTRDRDAAGKRRAPMAPGILGTALACLVLSASPLTGQRTGPASASEREPGADSAATRVTALVGLQRYHFESVGTAPEVELRAERRAGPVLVVGGSVAGSWSDNERADSQVRRSYADRWGFLVFLTGLVRVEVPGRLSPWIETGGGFFANSSYDALTDGAGLAGHVGSGISTDVADGWRIHLGYRLRKLAGGVGGTTQTFSVGVTLPAGPFGAPDLEPPDRIGR